MTTEAETWIRIQVVPVEMDERIVNFRGIPVVVRGGALECPSEYAGDVRAILSAAGFVADASGMWRRRNPQVAQPVPPDIPNGALEEIVSPSGSAAVRPAKKDRAALLWKVEKLEEKAFNLVEHREKVLSQVENSDEVAFATALTVGLDDRLALFRQRVVDARQECDSTFRSFLSVVAKAKASEYFTKRLTEVKQELESPNEERAKELEEISNRLKAFGGNYTSDVIARGIIGQLEDIERRVPGADSSSAMSSALLAETKLTAAIEGLKTAYQTRVDLHAQAKSQLEEMAGLSFVKQIHFTRDGVLRIHTTPATLKYRWKDVKDMHERDIVIGEYMISIALYGSHSGVRLENIKFPNFNYQHPHVSGRAERGQSICWGNISQSIKKLIKEWDFVPLLTLIWNFLNSYNYSDSYKQLFNIWKEWTGEELPKTEVK